MFDTLARWKSTRNNFLASRSTCLVGTPTRSTSLGSAQMKNLARDVDEGAELGHLRSGARKVEERSWLFDARLRQYVLQLTGVQILADQRAATMMARNGRVTRTATMSCAIISPSRMPASNPAATMSTRPSSSTTSIVSSSRLPKRSHRDCDGQHHGQMGQKVSLHSCMISNK
jgi:hypothetical protein